MSASACVWLYSRLYACVWPSVFWSMSPSYLCIYVSIHLSPHATIFLALGASTVIWAAMPSHIVSCSLGAPVSSYFVLPFLEASSTMFRPTTGRRFTRYSPAATTSFSNGNCTNNLTFPVGFESFSSVANLGKSWKKKMDTEHYLTFLLASTEVERFSSEFRSTGMKTLMNNQRDRMSKKISKSAHVDS